MSEQELEIYCRIVELKGLGKTYVTIGGVVGLSENQVSNKIGKLKHNFKNWSTHDNVLKRVCAKLSMTSNEVIDAVTTRKPFIRFGSKRMISVKINKTISSSKLWYYSKRGKTIDVIIKSGQYYTATPSKLRIRHQDCVEV